MSREEPSSVDRILFRGPVFQLGAFRATPEHPLFRDSGPAEYFDFVFPRTSLWIQHEGARPFVADPNVVTLYNQGQVYRRAPISPEGDKGDWISVAPATLREVIAEYDPGVADRPLRPFASDHTLSDPQTYIEQRRLFSYVMEAEQPDPLLVEEAALCLLVWVVARMYAERGAASRRELQPTPEQHDLVQRAKAVVLEARASRSALGLGKRRATQRREWSRGVSGFRSGSRRRAALGARSAASNRPVLVRILHGRILTKLSDGRGSAPRRSRTCGPCRPGCARWCRAGAPPWPCCRGPT